jgi:hypothetical protein
METGLGVLQGVSLMLVILALVLLELNHLVIRPVEMKSEQDWKNVTMVIK